MTAIPQPLPAVSVRTERWRRHGLAFAAAAAVVLLAGFHVAWRVLPNEYETDAVLTTSAPDASGLMTGNDAADVTRPAVLEPAAERLKRVAPGASPAAREAAAAELREQLTVVAGAPGMGETEVRVSARGGDAAGLANLVNAVAECYVSERASRNLAATQKAAGLSTETAALKSRLETLAPELESARAALSDFERQNPSALTDAGSDPDASLKTLLDETNQAASDYEKRQAEVAGLVEAEKLLRDRLKDVPEFSVTQEVTTVRNPELVALEREIRQMEKQLEDMLTRYTFRHPEVIALQTDLLLKKRQLQQLQQRVDDSVKTSKSQNPEYAVLKGKLDDTVVKLQVAKSALTPSANRKQSLAARFDALRAFLEPHRRLKTSLAQKEKLRQETESQIQAKSDELKAVQAALAPVPKLSRRAEVPATPTGPQRGAYALLAAVLALGAGWLSMASARRLSPRFAGPGEVERFVPHGVVAAAVGAAEGTEAHGVERMRRRLYLATTLGIVAVALIAAFAMTRIAPR